MPLTNALVSSQVFHYTGSDDYEDLFAYLSSRDYFLTKAEFVLRSDGSVRYNSGSNHYTVVNPGDWLTPRGWLSEEQFAEIARLWSPEEHS